MTHRSDTHAGIDSALLPAHLFRPVGGLRSFWVFEVVLPDGDTCQVDCEGLLRFGLQAETAAKDHLGSLAEAPFLGREGDAETEAGRRALACLSITGAMPVVTPRRVLGDGVGTRAH